MIYDWDVGKIRYHQRQMYRLLNSRNISIDKKEQLKNDIQELRELKGELNNVIPFPFIRKNKYVDETRMLSNYSYDDYLRIPAEIRKIVLSSMQCFKNFIDTYEEIELSKINLSFDDLISMSYDFYKWLPNKNYLTLFRKYTNPENNILRITKYSFSEYRGLTYFTYYPKYKPYVSIKIDNTLDDFITLNHEISHAIFFKNDSLKISNSPHYFLRELEGCFFDYLSTVYLKDKVDIDIINQLDYVSFVTEFSNIISFYLTAISVFLTKKYKNIYLDLIHKKIVKDQLLLSVGENNLKQFLRENAYENAKYIISYLVSLDLETIYNKDSEYAFHLFENIRNNKTTDILKNLRSNGVTFMDDGYVNLKKKIKKFGEIEK